MSQWLSCQWKYSISAVVHCSSCFFPCDNLSVRANSFVQLLHQPRGYRLSLTGWTTGCSVLLTQTSDSGKTAVQPSCLSLAAEKRGVSPEGLQVVSSPTVNFAVFLLALCRTSLIVYVLTSTITLYFTHVEDRSGFPHMQLTIEQIQVRGLYLGKD